MTLYNIFTLMVGILLISTVQDVQSANCPTVLDISSSTECIDYSTNKVNITVSCTTMPNYTSEITLYYRKSGKPYHVPDTPSQCFDSSDLANCYTNVTKVYNGEIDVSEIKSCSYSVVCNHYWDSSTCSNPAVTKKFYFKHCEIFPTIACGNMIPTVYENITVTKTNNITVTETKNITVTENSVTTSTETTTSTVKTTQTETTSIIYCTDDIGSGSCNCSSEPTTSQPNNAESTVSTNTIQTVQTNTIASSQIDVKTFTPVSAVLGLIILILIAIIVIISLYFNCRKATVHPQDNLILSNETKPPEDFQEKEDPPEDPPLVTFPNPTFISTELSISSKDN